MSREIFDGIKVKKELSRPLYIQIQEEIRRLISEKKLSARDRLPSLNQLCLSLNVSKDTVIKAYQNLQNEGVLETAHGKGFYIASTKRQLKVFCFFNELNEYKEKIFKAYSEKTINKASTDLYFHHGNEKIFVKMIKENLNHYDFFMIMPTFNKPSSRIETVLKDIPASKLVLFDRFYPIEGCSAVYQNFELDVMEGLEKLKVQNRKYHTLTIIYNESYLHPYETVTGANKYSDKHGLKFQVVNDINTCKSLRNQLVIALTNRDLVSLIRYCRNHGFSPAKDIGIISYNDTDLKEIIADGIAVISTDYEAMGEKLAEIILKTRKGIQVKNPLKVIYRPSL